MDNKFERTQNNSELDQEKREEIKREVGRRATEEAYNIPDAEPGEMPTAPRRRRSDRYNTAEGLHANQPEMIDIDDEDVEISNEGGFSVVVPKGFDTQFSVEVPKDKQEQKTAEEDLQQKMAEIERENEDLRQKLARAEEIVRNGIDKKMDERQVEEAVRKIEEVEEAAGKTPEEVREEAEEVVRERKNVAERIKEQAKATKRKILTRVAAIMAAVGLLAGGTYALVDTVNRQPANTSTSQPAITETTPDVLAEPVVSVAPEATPAPVYQEPVIPAAEATPEATQASVYQEPVVPVAEATQASIFQEPVIPAAEAAQVQTGETEQQVESRGKVVFDEWFARYAGEYGIEGEGVGYKANYTEYEQKSEKNAERSFGRKDYAGMFAQIYNEKYGTNLDTTNPDFTKWDSEAFQAFKEFSIYEIEFNMKQSPEVTAWYGHAFGVDADLGLGTKSATELDKRFDAEDGAEIRERVYNETCYRVEHSTWSAEMTSGVHSCYEKTGKGDTPADYNLQTHKLKRRAHIVATYRNGSVVEFEPYDDYEILVGTGETIVKPTPEPEPTPTPEPEPTPTPEPEPTPTPDPDPTPTPEPEPTPTPEPDPDPTPTPEPDPTPTPEPDPTPTPEPDPDPTPTPEPDPTPTPEPDPDPTPTPEPEPEPTPTPEPEPTPTPEPEPEPTPEPKTEDTQVDDDEHQPMGDTEFHPASEDEEIVTGDEENSDENDRQLGGPVEQDENTEGRNPDAQSDVEQAAEEQGIPVIENHPEVIEEQGNPESVYTGDQNYEGQEESILSDIVAGRDQEADAPAPVETAGQNDAAVEEAPSAPEVTVGEQQAPVVEQAPAVEQQPAAEVSAPAVELATPVEVTAAQAPTEAPAEGSTYQGDQNFEGQEGDIFADILGGAGN